MFCHLHVHDQYSLLDGCGKSIDFVKKAKQLKQTHLAITNHSSIDGFLDFQSAAKKEGIKPIFGCELYVVSDRFDKKERNRFHLTVLIKDEEGFRNLSKLLSIANLEGFYYKPRVDFDSILKYKKGLVFLSGCAASCLINPEGERFISDLAASTGEVYLEVMPHNFDQQIEVNKKCRQLSNKLGLELIATNDCHYINEEDSEIQEVLLAMQTKKKWHDKSRYRFSVDGLYLKSDKEMLEAFEKQEVLSKIESKMAIKNTMEIAKKCENFEIKKKDIWLPPIVGIEESKEDQYLTQLCDEGYEKIFGGDWKENYKERFEEEFELIKKKGFVRYFLIVHELISWCKKNDILTGPGRGSVGGSLIAYLMEITNVDPIKYNLLFSRFIDENRIDFPDIDIDFQDDKRFLIREHLEELYGKNNIASVSTFMKMKGRGVVRDVARVFDIPLKEVDEFAKKIIETDDEEDCIEKAIRETPEGKRFSVKYPQIIKYALKLEGQVKGCVDGESTVILEGKNGKVYTKKIKNLLRDNFVGRKIRAYDFEKDVLFFDEIQDVFYSGIKETIEITVLSNNGWKKNIALTFDHKILTKEGWKEANLIQLGDFIATNGEIKQTIKLCECGCGQEVKEGNRFLRGHCKGMLGKTPWNKGLTKEDNEAMQKSSERMKNNNPTKLEYVRKQVAKRSFKHGLFSHEFENLLKIDICEICGVKGSLDRHHKDKNRKNNKRDNIVLCCKKCHFEQHQRDFKINPLMTISFSKVISIKKSGHKKVYDITMKSSNQNFIANKILVHNCSQHAAALIVSAEDLTEGTRGNLAVRSGVEVVNWAKDDAEFMGLMKLDILGLNTLTILNETRRLIKENHNKDIDFSKIEPNNPQVFQMLSEGNTVGVFQFNTWSTTKLVKEVGIENFGLMSDVIALVRPGPADSGMTSDFVERKHGKKWKKKHEIYEEITKNTFGLIVYQEQIMQVISKVAGLSYSTADKIRKIVSKKRDVKLFDQYKEMFVNGCLESETLSKEEAEEFWEALEKHSNYSFNNSHSVEYALIGYYCAFCKLYFPAEFICANLTCGAKEKKEELVKEAERLGLNIILPKVGISDSSKWIVKGNELYVPFKEIKGVGDKTAEKFANYVPIEKVTTKKKIIQKQAGFFIKEKVKEVKVSQETKSKIEKILEEIGALGEEPSDDIQKYFSFQIPKVKYDDSKLSSISRNIPFSKLFTLNVEPGILKGLISENSYRDPEVLYCKDCELRKECSRPVMSSKGIWNAMIVGEAPGRGENEEGKGFIGKAGNTLWKELEKYSFSRRQFHITNVCKCWPSVTKTPKEEHIKICSKWIDAEIKNLRSKICLALGNIPLKYFKNEDGGISKLSGETEWIEEKGLWVCWCMHPSSVLRNPNNKNLFEKGIRNFAEKLNLLGGIK